MRPSQPEVAGYENLLRNIMLRAPEAALMSLGAFNWRTDTVGGVDIPNAYFSTGMPSRCVFGQYTAAAAATAAAATRFLAALV
jgi:hypothetical protein